MVSDNTSLVLSIMSLPVPAGVQGTDQPPPSTPSHGSGHSCGHGGAGTGAPQIKIRWDTDPNIRACTTRLLAWCNTDQEIFLKIFSDSSQDAANQGRRRQQMSAHKEHYFQQATDAVFKNDHDPNIRQLYGQDPSRFVNPIKNRFQL